MGKESDAIGQLFRNCFGWLAVTGAEALIITIGASATTFISVAVGTGKSGIDGYFLYFIWEFCRKEFSKIVIWLVV